MTMQQRPPRVQSVLHGPNEASCLQQALADGQRAQQSGYVPIAQSWGREGAGITLTILYELASPAPTPEPAAAPWSQPVATASAWTPPQPQPATTGWAAPTQPAQPTWAATQQQPYARGQQPVQRPPLSSATPPSTVSRRVAGAIASIVVFIVAFLVYSALDRALS